MKAFLLRLRTSPWIAIVILAALAGMFLPIFPDGLGGRTTLAGYVLVWAGVAFKAITGGVIGYAFCRHILRINLSEIPEGMPRALAGLAKAIVIAAFVVALALGT